MGFEALLGNQPAVNLLRRYLNQQKIPRSMIFYGPPSARVESFALAFAKALSCMELTDNYCDSCENCREINKGIFPDLNRVSPDGSYYRKEQITALIGDNRHRPMKSDRKIYLLSEAHQMRASAANAFLKVLEEPAETSVIILITHNLAGLLPTIRSRCQIIKFSPVSSRALRDHLVSRGMKEEEARIMANMSVSEQIDVFRKEAAALLTQRDRALEILDAMMIRSEEDKVLLDLHRMSRNRQHFLQWIEPLANLISLLLRDIIIIKIDDNRENLINFDRYDRIKSLSERAESGQILGLIERMETFMRDIRANLNIKTLIDEFFQNFSGFDKGVGH